MSINLGIIETAACINQVIVDPRCQDPAFALANPGICGITPQLVIKPGVAVACDLGSVQFKAFLVTSGNEVDVTDQTIFSSADSSIAIVGATSGNATGVGPGAVNIIAAYENYTAKAMLNVMSATKDCCAGTTVAFEFLIDVTQSMSSAFGGQFSTRLDFAKYAANQFIGKVNSGKDQVGAMSFTEARQTVLASIGTAPATIQTAIIGLTQTTDSTSFYKAVTAAVAALQASSAYRQVLVIVSDGEDEDPSDQTLADDPLVAASAFKAQGGVVICLGCRASSTDNGFAFLSALSTGGFFVNATPDNIQDAVNYFTGLMGYLCAGDCTPAGDVIIGQGELDFNNFQNWNVINGNVDLIGNGFFDLLPGNGLYVDLGGTDTPHDGLMATKNTFAVTAGHTYRLTVSLAGNQVSPDDGSSVLVSVVGSGGVLLQHTVIVEYSSGWQDYSFSFTATADDNVYLSIQENDTTSSVLPTPVFNPPTPPPSPVVTTPPQGSITGEGSPEGRVNGLPGLFYTDSITDDLWYKKSGTGNTGWQQLLG